MLRHEKYTLLLVAAVLAAAGIVRCAAGAAPADVVSAQEGYTERLMSIEGVVGTAAGADAVLVLCKNDAAAAEVPDELDGVSVRTKRTGAIETLTGGPGGERAARPVPIGVSTSAQGSRDAGTVACRVTDGGLVYALSTWSIWADGRSMGSEIVQPGGASSADAVLGTLAGYQKVSFSGVNRADAAVAVTSTEKLGIATPPTGYGRPSSRIARPSPGDEVAKYGAGTGLTSGTVVGVNAVLDVSYDGRTARFVDQLLVRSSGTFAGRGDSGSLLVTDDGDEPAGLLFAAGEGGRMAAANPIGDVLAAFGVSLDNRRLMDVAVGNAEASVQDGSVRVQVTVRNVGARRVNGDIDLQLTIQGNGTVDRQVVSGGLSVREAEEITFTWTPTDEVRSPVSLVASHSFSDDRTENNSATVSVPLSAE